jgi:hypothetical protein
LVYGTTDRQMQSNIPPLLWKGHNYMLQIWKCQNQLHFRQAFLSIWADKLIVVKAPLTFDSHLKINRGHLLVIIVPTTIPNMKTVDQSILKQVNGQAFWIKGLCGIDVKPSILKFNRVHLMAMINLYAKYEDWVKGFLRYWADKPFIS